MRQPSCNIERWLVLSQLPRFGGRSAAKLLSKYSIEQVFSIAPAQLPLTQPQITALSSPDWRLIDNCLLWAQQELCHIVSRSCDAYPPLLNELPDPPPLLFVCGDVTLLAQPQLAVVGSRAALPNHLENTRTLVAPIAAAGMCITSGLARGVDGTAHRTALQNKGKTIAVMATGPDRIYPAGHRDLAYQIVDQGGALVSEFVPGTPPLKQHFPKRNRIVSGLSLGTLVIAAGLKSGSLITARLAAEQGREVFAVPGAMSDPEAAGCHQLIKLGAKLVTSPVDILEEVMTSHVIAIEKPLQSKLPSGSLLDSVGDVATPLDLIVSRSGRSIEAVMQQLTMLEIEGEVAVVPGGYQRVRRTDYV
ncbi:DNA-processing protein DprA [Corallincola spongiicola]|uniref:DNA-protecting protein DprA n=1 Tax=Corallincola spongiicola TaxID=2520508 RepID=A0ABY1WLG6_9GAMM|nr:DNA-processing protein DprA [Corallincola spongiicola]TAA41109.1 DNA-protecting protein DprA [Corallincola spongiicola]